jgi:hypothetical protein
MLAIKHYPIPFEAICSCLRESMLSLPRKNVKYKKGRKEKKKMNP